jgi:hypothetical protein
MDNKTGNPPFVIPVKPNNTKPLYIVSVLILALSYFSFFYKALAQFSVLEIAVFSFMAVISGIWYFNIFKGKWPAKHGYIIFVSAGAVWFYQGGIGYMIGILVIFSGIVQLRVKASPAIMADNNGVALKNIFIKHYNWQEMNNVVIKDGLVTVDCKNNRLYQKEIAGDISPEFEAEFNEFCRLKTGRL